MTMPDNRKRLLKLLANIDQQIAEAESIFSGEWDDRHYRKPPNY
jgi:hypothetical protein